MVRMPVFTVNSISTEIVESILHNHKCTTTTVSRTWQSRRIGRCALRIARAAAPQKIAERGRDDRVDARRHAQWKVRHPLDIESAHGRKRKAGRSPSRRGGRCIRGSGRCGCMGDRRWWDAEVRLHLIADCCAAAFKRQAKVQWQKCTH